MIGALLLLLLGFALTAVIIAANGYFVAQEFAYMSVDRSTLRARAEKGDAAAERALRVTRRTSFMLSGAQLGITVTGLLVGFVAEPFIGAALGALLGAAGVPAAAGIAIGTVGALILATVVQMIFGELYPKNLAIANADPLARALARSTLIYLAVFGWLITIFDKASNAVLRLVRVEPVHDVDSSATVSDLERIIDDSRASGDLPVELSLLLDRILDFPDQDVEHAMIPRVRVGAVSTSTTISEVRSLMAQAHTRYPVIGERDEPVGVVHLVDVLATTPDDPRPVTAIMREPVVVATLMPLTDALPELSRTRNELACVIDEYGGFAGIVTIEDLAEELVGEITDEHDDAPPAAPDQPTDGVWELAGDVHVDEVERILGRDLPAGDYETLAGLIIARAGRLPDAGERVSVELPEEGGDFLEDVPMRRSVVMDVLDVDRYIPRRVRLSVLETPLDEVSGASVEPAEGEGRE